MAKVKVRYLVDHVDAAIGFYCGQLGFDEVTHPAPTFAMLAHGDLRLVPSAPGAVREGSGPAGRDYAAARRLESLSARGRRHRGDGGQAASLTAR